MQEITTSQPVSLELKTNHYALVRNGDLLIPDGLSSARTSLMAEWGKLEKDNYLKNGSSFRYRRFRYFYFEPATGQIRAYAPAPYYQPTAINRYAGGIDREIGIIEEDMIRNPFLSALVQFDFEQLPISPQTRRESWLVDIHQMRIVTSAEEHGEPTPEGIHHDENDFVWIHLVGRKNITGGATSIYSNERELLESCTLAESMDSVVIWDPKVMHGVSTIRPSDPAEEAYRDILLVCFTHCPDIAPPSGDLDSDYAAIKSAVDSMVSRTLDQSRGSAS